jgi:hypothetical protein
VNTSLTFPRLGAGLGAVLVATLSFVPAAYAADGTGFQAGKDRCHVAIDNRHTALATLGQQVNAAPTLSVAHHGTIAATISASNAGLDGLKPAIDAAADRAALAAACHPITVDYRVYALVVPQSEMAIGFDAGAAAAVTFNAYESGADAVIAAEKAAGKDTSAPEATLASLRAESASIATAIDGKADGVLTVKPADWNANRAVLEPYRESLVQSVEHLKGARVLASQLAAQLKM